MYNLFPTAFMDPPAVLNAAVTPIPGSGGSPLQICADTGKKASYAIDFIDSTGDYVGVYVGPSGQEVLSAIIGGGVVNRSAIVIGAHSRVSLRSITSSAITNGHLSMVFMALSSGNPGGGGTF